MAYDTVSALEKELMLPVNESALVDILVAFSDSLRPYQQDEDISALLEQVERIKLKHNAPGTYQSSFSSPSSLFSSLDSCPYSTLNSTLTQTSSSSFLLPLDSPPSSPLLDVLLSLDMPPAEGEDEDDMMPSLLFGDFFVEEHWKDRNGRPCPTICGKKFTIAAQASPSVSSIQVTIEVYNSVLRQWIDINAKRRELKQADLINITTVSSPLSSGWSRNACTCRWTTPNFFTKYLDPYYNNARIARVCFKVTCYGVVTLHHSNMFELRNNSGLNIKRRRIA